MPRWLRTVLTRTRSLALEQRVSFTLKARRELASLHLDQQDACDVLASLSAADSAGRLNSPTTGEWAYVFKPVLPGTVLYVKLILRND